MKTLVTLSDEQILLLKANGSVRINADGYTEYSLPQIFKSTDREDVFEICFPMPEYQDTEVFVIVCRDGANEFSDFVFTNYGYAERLVTEHNKNLSPNDSSRIEVMNIYDFGEYMHNSGSSAAMFE